MNVKGQSHDQKNDRIFGQRGQNVFVKMKEMEKHIF